MCNIFGVSCTDFFYGLIFMESFFKKKGHSTLVDLCVVHSAVIITVVDWCVLVVWYNVDLSQVILTSVIRVILKQFNFIVKIVQMDSLLQNIFYNNLTSERSDLEQRKIFFRLRIVFIRRESFIDDYIKHCFVFFSSLSLKITIYD